MRINCQYQHLMLSVGRTMAANWRHRFSSTTTSTAILCPGQGTQYVGMLGGDVGNRLIESSTTLNSIAITSKEIFQHDLVALGNHGPSSVQKL